MDKKEDCCPGVTNPWIEFIIVFGRPCFAILGFITLLQYFLTWLISPWWGEVITAVFFYGSCFFIGFCMLRGCFKKEATHSSWLDCLAVSAIIAVVVILYLIDRPAIVLPILAVLSIAEYFLYQKFKKNVTENK